MRCGRGIRRLPSDRAQRPGSPPSRSSAGRPPRGPYLSRGTVHDAHAKPEGIRAPVPRWASLPEQPAPWDVSVAIGPPGDPPLRQPADIRWPGRPSSGQGRTTRPLRGAVLAAVHQRHQVRFGATVELRLLAAQPTLGLGDLHALTGAEPDQVGLTVRHHRRNVEQQPHDRVGGVADRTARLRVICWVVSSSAIPRASGSDLARADRAWSPPRSALMAHLHQDGSGRTAGCGRLGHRTTPDPNSWRSVSATATPAAASRHQYSASPSTRARKPPAVAE
jgi:hypothetical protein